MADRAKYMTLVLTLYVASIAVILAGVSAVLDQPFLDSAVNLAPAIILGLIGMVIHAARHDLDT